MSSAPALLSLCSAFVWLFVFFWKQQALEKTRLQREKDEEGLHCSQRLVGISSSKTRPSVQDQRRHGGWGPVVFLLYLHDRLLAGARLCLEVWELCALFCKRQRQAGDKQESREHSDCLCFSLVPSMHPVVSLIILILSGRGH